MTRKLPWSAVSPELAAKYLEKARRFRRDALVLRDQTGAVGGNGIAVLCIHAAIAFADALTIRTAGRKSKSGDHRDAAPFLASVLPIQSPDDKAALKAFQALLSRKDGVSYADDAVTYLNAEMLLAYLERFATWAERRYNPE